MRKTGVGGSLDAVSWRHWPDPVAAVEEARRQSRRVVVVEQGAGAVDWREADLSGPMLLVLGHERAGVRDSVVEQADQIVALPVRGVTNSLNVATCASVLLYGALATL